MPAHHLLIHALGAVLVLASGCASLSWKHSSPVKYETVPTSNRHDTATAKKKHGEALALLEDADRATHLAKAESLLNEALVADVTYGPAHNSLGMAYFLQDKLYLAAWEFEYAAKLMPEHPQPLNNLGLVYERVGKYDEAISYYSMAMSHAPNDSQVIGNLVRARLTTGDRSGDLKGMASDLALNHPDAGWRTWAREQVELTRFEEASGVDSWTTPPAAREALPAPIPEPEAVSPLLEMPQSMAPTRE